MTGQREPRRPWTGRIGAAMLVCCAVLLVLVLCLGEARWPAEPGSSLKKNGKLQVDVSHAEDGYFLAALQKTNTRRMKLRVTKGKETLTYELNSSAEFEVFPLQLGDGKYDITLYENVSGKKYATAGKVSLSVRLKDQEGCFYYPNQFVNYTPQTPAVAKSEELCAGMAGLEAYVTVKDYMKRSYRYDYIKAMNIQPGVLPDLEGCYATGKGICQDLSAIMCCMLRTRGIPAHLVIGYADDNYHAWVVAVIDGKEYFFDPTVAVSGMGKIKTYSVERWY